MSEENYEGAPAQNNFNLDLWKRTRAEPIAKSIRRRKWQWIGHILRGEQGAVEKQALNWKPQGKRKRRRPKATWRISMEKEAGENLYRDGSPCKEQRAFAELHRCSALSGRAFGLKRKAICRRTLNFLLALRPVQRENREFITPRIKRYWVTRLCMCILSNITTHKKIEP